MSVAVNPFDVTGAALQAMSFAARRAPEQDLADGAPRPLLPVVVVGAGPVGLTLAIDLAQRGQPVVLLDNDCRLSTGSRAICFAKRTLEIWDRLGVGERMNARGVSWSIGRVFFKDSQVFQFDLLPEDGHERPAFINLQQYYAEAYLVERAMQLPLIDLRWCSTVSAVTQAADRVTLTVDTPDGNYRIDAEHVAACDGSRSALRGLLGQESKGRQFKDRFLIADVRMDADLHPRAHGDPSIPQALRQAQDDCIRPSIPQGERIGNGAKVFKPTKAAGLASPARRPSAPPGGSALHEVGSVGANQFQRWFWFDPPFHPNQSVLLHRQPDNVWRIDFQLGWDADPEVEKRPEHIIPRVKALLGEDVPFELEWASVYTFSCLRMDAFTHGRVHFLGDAAHGVSPFGARGANSGVQDAENLAWKLDAVLRGEASAALLASYGSEREYAADENILNSTRATDFITPKSEISRLFRDAVLELARTHPFARRLVNSGRLSIPAVLCQSELNTPDSPGDNFGAAMVPGAAAADAPLVNAGSADGATSWLLRELAPGFTLLVFGAEPAWAGSLGMAVFEIMPTGASRGLIDSHGLAAQRYDARPGTAYLIRPDQHVCARWRQPTAAHVFAAKARALGHSHNVATASAASLIAEVAA
jgi:3-(3-hydroxy-phenyl)propionate hydroxylase